MMIVYLIAGTVIYAVYGFIKPWIMGGIDHLMLMMFGGVADGKGYSDTVRAHAYASASAWAWMIIPIPYLNYFIFLVFTVINHVHAYDEVHRCGGGKAFAAAVIPAFTCCCCAPFTLGLISGVLGNL